jgi:hypothetical protein
MGCQTKPDTNQRRSTSLLFLLHKLDILLICAILVCQRRIRGSTAPTTTAATHRRRLENNNNEDDDELARITVSNTSQRSMLAVATTRTKPRQGQRQSTANLTMNVLSSPATLPLVDGSLHLLPEWVRQLVARVDRWTYKIKSTMTVQGGEPKQQQRSVALDPLPLVSAATYERNTTATADWLRGLLVSAPQPSSSSTEVLTNGQARLRQHSDSVFNRTKVRFARSSPYYSASSAESLADRTDCGETEKENASPRIATEEPSIYVVTWPEKATITNRRIMNSNADAGRTKSASIECASWFWLVKKCVLCYGLSLERELQITRKD